MARCVLAALVRFEGGSVDHVAESDGEQVVGQAARVRSVRSAHRRRRSRNTRHSRPARSAPIASSTVERSSSAPPSSKSAAPTDAWSHYLARHDESSDRCSVRSCPRAGRWSWPRSTVRRPSGSGPSPSPSSAEELGYDSIWVYDHFHNVPRPAHEAVFECWTTLAAISQRTSRVRLGQMVGCNSYRNPGLLAKITSNVDVISGGRLDWGIGAGWYENEYRGYGFEFPTAEGSHRDAAGDRRDRQEHVDTGRDDVRRYVLRRCHGPTAIRSLCSIRTRRSGSAVAVSSSRCVSWPVTPTARTSAAAPSNGPASGRSCRATAADVGRDEETIRKTWSPEMFIRATEAEVDAAGSPQPVGRTGGALAGGQPRRYTGAGRREAADSTSTSAAPASSRGAPTIPTPRRSSALPTKSSRASADHATPRPLTSCRWSSTTSSRSLAGSRHGCTSPR